MAVLRDREALQRGEDVPDYCWHVSTETAFNNAYAVIARLTGEASS